MRIVTFLDSDGLYSVVCALGIIAERVSKEAAAAAIVATVDVSPIEAALYLDSPVSAAEFRSAWSQAVGGTLSALANNRQTVDLLTTISIQLGTILDRFEREDSAKLRADLEAKIFKLIDRLKARLAEHGQSATDEQIAAFLLDDGEPAALELQKLLEAR